VLDEMTGASLGDATVTIASVDKGDPEKWAVRMLVPLSRGGRIECKAAYTSADRSTREIFQVCRPLQHARAHVRARAGGRCVAGPYRKRVIWVRWEGSQGIRWRRGATLVLNNLVRAGVRPGEAALWDFCALGQLVLLQRRLYGGHLRSLRPPLRVARAQWLHLAVGVLRRARGEPAERRWLREADLGVELAARVAVTTTLAASTGAIVLPSAARPASSERTDDRGATPAPTCA